MLQFSNQGLVEPATKWLRGIAAKEGLDLAPKQARKIIRSSKNNMRAALQSLEAILAERQMAGDLVQQRLPVVTSTDLDAQLTLDAPSHPKTKSFART